MLKDIKNKIDDKVTNTYINKLVYLSIFVIFAGFIINGCFLKISENISESLYKLVDILLLLIEGSIIGYTLLILLLKRPKRILTIYGISIGIFLISYFIFPQNREQILDIIKPFFLYNLTSLILFLEIGKDKELFNKVVKISKIIFLFALIYFAVLLMNDESIYNIWLAKFFFISACFTACDYYKNKNITSILVSILSAILLLMTGSRTYLIFFALLVIALLFAAFVKFIRKKSLKKKILVLTIFIIVAGVCALVVLNYQQISDMLYDFFASKGINIRILRLLSTENFLKSDGRLNVIYPTAMNIIKENWLIGAGIGGDRTIIYKEVIENNIVKKGYEANAYYSHNIILELYATFGVIISTIIIAFIIYCYYKVWYNQKVKSDIIFCMSWVSILPLMLTGTLWDNVYFWALLGILLNACLKNDSTKEEGNVKKKIFMLLNNCFEPDIRVYKEAKYLVKTGTDVEILCIDKKNKFIDRPEDELEGIKIKRFFARTEKTTKLIEKSKIIAKLKYIIYFFWLMKFIRKVKKYLKDKEFEILHCHDLVMAFCGVIFFKNKKIVFDMHEYYGNGKNKVKNFFIKKIVFYTQNRAEWIIHVNEIQKNSCQKKNINKLIEIPNYPELSAYTNINKTNSDKIRISYIGKVRDFYSISKLIDCSKKFERMEFKIYGNGSQYDNLLKYAKEKGKENVMMGYFDAISESEKIYNNTDVLYSVYDIKGKESLNWKNAMPVKSYEAIITLTPIIASENTILGNFVKEKNIGFTIDIRKEGDLEKILKSISDNPDVLKEKIESIKEIQYTYTWEEVVKRLDKIYK